jgi:class 3 adenylate cyclase
VSRLQRRRFSEPADVRRFPHGRVDVVELDDIVVGRMTYEPGWRWSQDVKPVAGTELCQYHHVGVTLQGRLRVEMPDGLEMEIGPGDVFEIPPGHDAWVVGDAPWVSVDFEAMRSYGRTIEDRGDRFLTSMLFTDIVGSTALAATLGPSKWKELLAQHNERAERVIDRHHGRLAETTGDGLLALFDGAERAVRSAIAVREAMKALDLEIRQGVHTGEIELVGGSVRGIAVHLAARIMALAGPGEILVSSTVRDLVDASGLAFLDRGAHELKGFSGARQVFAVVEEKAAVDEPAALEEAAAQG